VPFIDIFDNSGVFFSFQFQYFVFQFTNHCLIYFSSSFQPTNVETTRDGRHLSESSYRLDDH